jgi:hypothetical protein
MRRHQAKHVDFDINIIFKFGDEREGEEKRQQATNSTQQDERHAQ